MRGFEAVRLLVFRVRIPPGLMNIYLMCLLCR